MKIILITLLVFLCTSYCEYKNYSRYMTGYKEVVCHLIWVVASITLIVEFIFIGMFAVGILVH